MNSPINFHERHLRNRCTCCVLLDAVHHVLGCHTWSRLQPTEFSHSTRWTVDGDPEMYPGAVVYFDARLPADVKQLWWDLRYVHMWVAKRGDTYTYKDWLRKVARLVDGVHGCARASLVAVQTAEQAFLRTYAQPSAYSHSFGFAHHTRKFNFCPKP